MKVNPSGDHAQVLDQRGRLCPLPVIALATCAQGLRDGEVIVLLADDPAAQYDIPAWCGMRGHHVAPPIPSSDGHGMAYRVTIGSTS